MGLMNRWLAMVPAIGMRSRMLPEYVAIKNWSEWLHRQNLQDYAHVRRLLLATNLLQVWNSWQKISITSSVVLASEYASLAWRDLHQQLREHFSNQGRQILARIAKKSKQ